MEDPVSEARPLSHQICPTLLDMHLVEPQHDKLDDFQADAELCVTNSGWVAEYIHRRLEKFPIRRFGAMVAH